MSADWRAALHVASKSVWQSGGRDHVSGAPLHCSWLCYALHAGFLERRQEEEVEHAKQRPGA